MTALHAAIFAVLVSSMSGANAQTVSANPASEPQVLVLPYKSAESLHGGKLVYAQGVAGAGRSHQFALEGLAITQPVVVAVQAKDPGKKVHLSAGKLAESSPAKTQGKRSVSDSDGRASLSFRSQGEARITVRTEATTPYQLMVWVGPEIKLPMRSPFKAVSPEQLRSTQGMKP